MAKHKVTLLHGNPLTIPLQHHMKWNDKGEITGPNYHVETVDLVVGKPVVVELEDRVVADLKVNPHLSVDLVGGATVVEDDDDDKKRPEQKRSHR